MRYASRLSRNLRLYGGGSAANRSRHVAFSATISIVFNSATRTVVRDDDGIGTGSDRLLGIVRIEDALQDKRQGAEGEVTRLSIAEELESAADRIADMSRADLQIILRRAALMLRNVAGVPLEPATEDALNSIAGEMGIGKSDLIQIVLREWLETNAYLPVRMIDDDSETDGSA